MHFHLQRLADAFIRSDLHSQFCVNFGTFVFWDNAINSGIIEPWSLLFSAKRVLTSALFSGCFHVKTQCCLTWKPISLAMMFMNSLSPSLLWAGQKNPEESEHHLKLIIFHLACSYVDTDTHLCRLKKLPLSGWFLKFCAIRTAMSLRIVRLLWRKTYTFNKLVEFLLDSYFLVYLVVPSEGAWLFSAVCPRRRRARLAPFWDTADIRIVTHAFTWPRQAYYTVDTRSQTGARSPWALTSAATSATFPCCGFSPRISVPGFQLWRLSWSCSSSLSPSREF